MYLLLWLGAGAACTRFALPLRHHPAIASKDSTNIVPYIHFDLLNKRLGDF